MYWNAQIKLGQKVEREVDGEVIESYDWSMVFANKLSIRQSEFYESAKIGLRPELSFAVRNESFDNHDKVDYKGKEYSIIRTYANPKNETVELILSAMTGE